jgi:hypothetical protein
MHRFLLCRAAGLNISFAIIYLLVMASLICKASPGRQKASPRLQARRPCREGPMQSMCHDGRGRRRHCLPSNRRLGEGGLLCLLFLPLPPSSPPALLRCWPFWLQPCLSSWLLCAKKSSSRSGRHRLVALLLRGGISPLCACGQRRVHAASLYGSSRCRPGFCPRKGTGLSKAFAFNKKTALENFRRLFLLAHLFQPRVVISLFPCPPAAPPRR